MRQPVDDEPRALRLHLASEAISERSADRADAMLYLSQLGAVHGHETVVDILEMAQTFGLPTVLTWARNDAAVRKAVR